MINTDFLYEGIIPSSEFLKITKTYVRLRIYNDGISIDSRYIKKVLENVKTIIMLEDRSIKIELHFYGKTFGDEAVVMYMELIILSLFLKDYNNIYLWVHDLDVTIAEYPLYYNSRLNRYIKQSHEIIGDYYLRDYTDAYVNAQNNYCIKNYFDNALLLIAENNGDHLIQSFSSSLIMEYLNKIKNLGPSFKKKILKVISEIIDNSLSHTKSDCIVSIKNYEVVDQQSVRKFMISVAIANFSEKYLFTDIKDKIVTNSLNCASSDIVYKAYENNKINFNENFDFEFFCMISAFQKSVTTRLNAKNNSGRGLTTFLNYLIRFSELDCCYVYSSNKLLWFNKKYLNVVDGLVGFNDKNDYINELPNSDNYRIMPYNNNGTLFNLKLIYDWSDLIE